MANRWKLKQTISLLTSIEADCIPESQRLISKGNDGAQDKLDAFGVSKKNLTLILRDLEAVSCLTSSSDCLGHSGARGCA
jgi:hypothetical protein